MSRTDKTAPFWVKLMRGDLASEEVHDHCEGPCDLPAHDVVDSWVRPHKTTCHRTFTYTGVHVCCCKFCHGDFWSVAPGRRQRLDGKRACREWESEY